MFVQTVLSFGALLSLTVAQSAPGFPVSAPQQLTVTFGNNTVSPPGELIPRGGTYLLIRYLLCCAPFPQYVIYEHSLTTPTETAQPPSISAPVWTSGSRGVLLMVDLDVPRNNTRVQLLHWLAPNVTLGSSNSSGPTPLNVPVGFAPYLQPSPPVGDVPHAYTFIVFPQPANFSIPAKYADLANNRVGFNTSQFLADTGLSNAIAANYIRVQNLTGTATQTYPPARPTETGARNSSSAVPFPGTAAPVVVSSLTVWAGVVTALLAGVAAVVL